MSRRDRLEAKLARREEWAGKADARSEARHAAVSRVADAIPFGQPILVGHHSERHARRDAERIRSGMDKAVAESQLADHHRAKAAGLEAQLARSVFSDDDDAIATLQARIDVREALCTHRKAVNAAWRKLEGEKPARLAALVSAGVITADEGVTLARFFGTCHWEENPYPAYANNNARNLIRADKKRIDEIKARAAAAERATQAGGVLIETIEAAGGGHSYTRVTFAEKPEPQVLDALRAAGYRWGGGSWVGQTASLPACVSELASV